MFKNIKRFYRTESGRTLLQMLSVGLFIVVIFSIPEPYGFQICVTLLLIISVGLLGLGIRYLVKDALKEMREKE